MRSLRATGLAALLAGVLAVPGAAAGQDTWEPTPGGWVSGNVSYVDTIPIDAGTAIDAVVHDGFLYVTSFRGFTIYDVSNPLSPQLAHHEPAAIHMINEQPQTNGEILLLSNDGFWGTLDVWDVTDKSDPQRLASMSTPKIDHMWACVLDCAYAYSSHGTIVDLADPADPQVVGDWTNSVDGNMRNFHDITEVAPGLVLVGSLPVVYLDAGDDPAEPEVLATFEPHSRQYNQPYIIVRGHNPSVPARVDWPVDATDRYVLVSMETPFSGDCQENSGTFGTYDSDGWDDPEVEDFEFRLIDEYGMDENGLPSDGAAPTNFWGCSAYAFEISPDYADERLAAVTFMEHGVRLLGIDDDGMISDTGGFVPLGGSVAAARWVTDEVLYSIDLHRGIDILRVQR
jgi:hypothetical protein